MPHRLSVRINTVTLPIASSSVDSGKHAYVYSSRVVLAIHCLESETAESKTLARMSTKLLCLVFCCKLSIGNLSYLLYLGIRTKHGVRQVSI